jgi:hypothetical protein
MKTLAQPEPLTDAELDRLGDFLVAVFSSPENHRFHHSRQIFHSLQNPRLVVPSAIVHKIFGVLS